MSLMRPSAPEFSQMLFERDPDLASLLGRRGSIRGLFDQNSAEAKNFTAHEKLAILRRLVFLRFHVEQLENAFLDVMVAKTYDVAYAKNVFTSGVCALLQAAVRDHDWGPVCATEK